MYEIVNLSSGIENILLLLVRIIIAVVMIYYGLPKLRDLKSNGNDFVQMGFKPGIFWGTIIALLEFFGGIAMMVGFYIWVVAILFGFEMFMGTLWKITKAKKPFTDYSYDVLLLALMIMLFITGPGAFTLL